MRIEINFHHPSSPRVGSSDSGAYLHLAEEGAAGGGALYVYVSTVAQADLFLTAAKELHREMCMVIAQRQDAAAVRADELCPWFYTPEQRTDLLRAAEDAATEGTVDVDDVIREYITNVGPQPLATLAGAPVCASDLVRRAIANAS